MIPGKAYGQQIADNRFTEKNGVYWLEEVISSLDMVQRWQAGQRGLERVAVYKIVTQVRNDNNYTHLIGKVTPSQFDILYDIRQDYIRISSLIGDRSLSSADVKALLSGFNFDSRLKYLLGIRNQLRAAGYDYMRPPDDVATRIYTPGAVRVVPVPRTGW